jgi:hypothetical protein
LGLVGEKGVWKYFFNRETFRLAALQHRLAAISLFTIAHGEVKDWHYGGGIPLFACARMDH